MEEGEEVSPSRQNPTLKQPTKTKKGKKLSSTRKHLNSEESKFLEFCGFGTLAA
jgi:hypothetical protein